jgi:hypothetical protein
MPLKPTQLMIAPAPFSLTHREVMMRMSPCLYRSSADWSGLHPVLGGAVDIQPTGTTPELNARVRATVAGERFLRWSRFPYYVRGSGADSNTIFVGDARYASGTTESWAGIRVQVK